tara:strand:- start:31 stop:357 length:327 start_codon:yes stop_codon:yes gene_type:complete
MFISPTNDYPRYTGDIQLEHPDFVDGDTLPDGWVNVAEAPFPEDVVDRVVYEEFPIEIDGVMTQNWVTREPTDEEIERRDAPANAKARLIELGFTESEIFALVAGLVR